MDRDYLQNIAGSPHVDEGLGDRIMARGSSGAQRFSAMSGGDIQDLNYTKIETLFNKFIKRVSDVLKDFADGDHSVANRLEQSRPPISSQQRDTIEELRSLYASLTPSTIMQHQLGNGGLNPPANRSKLTEMLKEGIFSRELSLNKALQTNDPNTILSAYINELKKSYDSFVMDAMKITGAPRDYVKRVVGNLNKNWSPVLNKVETIVRGGVPPVLPTTQPTQTAAAPPTAVPPVLPKQPSAPTTEPSANGGSTPSPQTASSQSDTNLTANSSEDDFAIIVSNTIDTLIAAVQNDADRAAPYFQKGNDGKYSQLPQSWNAPAVTKEAKDGEELEPDQDDNNNDNATQPKAEPDEPEVSSEFLYNFHARYDKQRNFAIEVPAHDKSKTYHANRKTKELNKFEVIWANKRHENDIHVKHTPIKKEKKKDAPTGKDEEVDTAIGEAGHVLLMKFWDDQVDPRTPSGKNFSVKMLLDQAHPQATKILGKVSPKILTAIQAKTDALQRALFATVQRKSMEFKSKGITLTIDDKGNVYRVKKSGNELIPTQKIQDYINSTDAKERQRWVTALTKAGFFTKFPEMQPKSGVTIDQIPAAMDTVKALTTVGIKQVEAWKSVQDAVNVLGDKATTQEYFKHATKGSSVSATTPSPTSVSSSPSKPVSASPSAPVSSAPKPTTPAPVTAPVSKPASSSSSEKPTEKHDVQIGDDGSISFTDPSSKEKKVRKIGHMLPKWVGQAIANDSGMSKKYQDMLAKRKAAKVAKTSGTSLEEEIVNPFSSENFL